MTLALSGKSRTRRGALLVAATIAIVSATLGALSLLSVAFAHTAQYDATAQCDGSWTALGQYIAGNSSAVGDRRLVVLHLASIDGVTVPTGSSGLAANQPFGDGGPDGSNGLVPNTTYTALGGNHVLTGATIAPGDYVWVGAQGTTGILFSMSGGAGTLVLSPGAWAGSITLYQWNGSAWVAGNAGDNKDINAPSLPQGCAPLPNVNTLKSHTPSGPVAAGGTFQWVLTTTVTNGPITQATHITDAAPTGMTFGAITTSVSGGGDTSKFSCTAASASPIDCTVAVGAPTGVYVIAVTVTAPAANIPATCKDYINTASANYGTAQPSDNPGDTVNVTGCTTPHVETIKSHTPPGSVAAGGAFHWMLTTTVSNGPITQPTHITDSAPAGMIFGAIAASASGGGDGTKLTCTAASGSPLDCTIATGAPSGTYVIDVTVTAPAANNTANCHDYTNTASANYGTAQDTGSPSDTVTVTTCANPGISILKVDDVQGTVAAGGSFNWIVTVTVTNGPTTNDFVVTDTAPPGITFGNIIASGTGAGTFTGNASASPVNWTLASGAGNGTYILTIAATAPGVTPSTNCTDYTNTASIGVVGAQQMQSSDKVTVTDCVRKVTVVKDVDNVTNDPTQFDVTFDGSPTGDYIQEAGGPGHEYTNSNVSTAGHTVTETLPGGYAVVGWIALTGGVCNDHGTPADFGTGTTANVPPGSSDVLICFTNHKDPTRRIIIHKIVDNIVDDATPFPFMIDGSSVGSTAETDANGITQVVDTGAHTAIEGPIPAGYQFVSVELCPGVEVPENTEQLAVEALVNGFDVPAGDGDVIICFHNEAVGRIVVEKTDNTGGTPPQPASWAFTVSGPNAFNNANTIAAGAGTHSYAIENVPLGSGYTAAETNGNFTACPVPDPAPGTWRSQAIDGAQDLTTPGQTITFHFVNSACAIVSDTGNLTIHKFSDANSNHTVDVGDFGIMNWKVTVTGPEFPSGQAFFTDASGTVFLPGIEAGAYTVVEENQAGYTVVGVINGNGTFSAGSSTGSATVSSGVLTTHVDFFNHLNPPPGCTAGCAPPSVTPPPPTVTAIPPTATPTTVPPTATPTKTIDIVEGAKTPGPGTTPIAPSTGSGFFGTSGGSTNTLMALFGLFVLSAGLATLAVSRRNQPS